VSLGKPELTSSSIEARWHNAPPAPLAFGHLENPIHDNDIESWLQDITKFAKIFPEDSSVKNFIAHGSLDSDLLRQRYQSELRFLSRKDAKIGLNYFADQITQRFSPENTLFYLPPESVSAHLLHQTLLSIKSEIGKYGVAMDSRQALRLAQKNNFKSNNISDAAAFVYVDDWILSGDHIRNFLTNDVAGRFHTFHLVVSDAGLEFFKATSQYVDPNFFYTIKSSNPKSFYPDVPLFGFHEIPDRVPRYYVQSKNTYYSIFGKNSDDFVRPGARLIDHRHPF